MADDAAADRAHDAVMTGVMAGDAADDRAFQAALRLGGRGRHRRHGIEASIKAAAIVANFMMAFPWS